MRSKRESSNGAILVTGGCGFIGSHLVDRLIEENERVVVVDNLSTGRLANLNARAEFAQGDIKDDKFLVDVFSRHGIDRVIHQAAKINWGAQTELPLHDVGSNIVGTLNILECCERFGVRKLVYASSVAVYGRPKALPVSENDPQLPIYSYGIAKRCAEEYVLFYNKRYGVPYVILRYANVYGPRQPVYGEVGVVAIYTEQILKGEPLVIYGDGEHVRDYIFIDDVVDVTLRALCLEAYGIVNVGTGVGVTTNQVFHVFCEATDRKPAPICLPERPEELGKLFLDVSRAKDIFGWEAQVEFKEGIARTLSYYMVTSKGSVVA